VARHAEARIGHHGLMPDLATPAADPDAWFTMPVLSGRLVRLAPITLEPRGIVAVPGGGGERLARWSAWATFSAPA